MGVFYYAEHDFFQKGSSIMGERALCCFSFSLSLILDEIFEINDRLIGGKGGLVRFKSPALELNGVRGFVS